MWIEPNSTVKVLQNIPIDIEFNNTLWFNSKEEQTAYFNTCVKHIVKPGDNHYCTYNRVSYQRIERNYIRVEENAGDLYDCNYLMFKNTSFENKWFYAFITKVEYIANKVAEIEYVIDPLQTWFWDCDFAESFVVRQHAVWDDFGANRLPENIAPCDYNFVNLDSTGWFDVQAIVIETSSVFEKKEGGNELLEQAAPNMIGSIAQGINFTYFKFRMNDSTVSDGTNIPVYTRKGALEKAYEYIDKTVSFNGSNAQDRLIGMFQCPAAFFENYVNPTIEPVDPDHDRPWVDVQTCEPFSKNTSITRPSTLGNYGEPHNRKLLQYPYNFLYITDCRQNDMLYKYEDFIKPNGELEQYQSLTLNIKGVISADPSMMIVPRNYNGAEWDITSKFVIKGFPQCSINADMWKAYVASNGGIIPTVAKGLILPLANESGHAINDFTKLAQSDTDIEKAFQASTYTPKKHQVIKGVNEQAMINRRNAQLAGNRIGRMYSGVTAAATIASAIGSFNANMGQAPAVTGNANGDVIYSAGYYDFRFGQKCIKPQLAKIIDDYFDMFGYLTNEVTRPNLSSRPHWNYVQVIDANLIGDIPQDDLEDLKGIFNKGITFWKHAEEVGKYEYDNWSDSHR